MEKLLISVSGVRGVVGKALTADIALRYASAFGTFLKTGKVVIGGDTRRTHAMIKSAAIAGLQGTGHDVVDIGIVPTPTVEIAVRDGGFVGGIAVTASHNPDQYNALKLIGPGGLFLSETQGLKVRNIYEKNLIKNVGWDKVGTLAYDLSWIDSHIEKIISLDIISIDQIKQSNLKVVADCVGGTAAMMAARFFDKIGVSHELIHFRIGDKFPRGAEPTPENLVDLCKAVKESGADIGFAFDPDADRLALVSDKGEPLGEEFTLALGARYILSRVKGPIAVNLSSSMINDFVANEAGVKIYRTKVGERNVTEKMMKIGAVVGGEGNGGLIYPRLHWGRDGFLGAAVILQYLASSGKKISALAAELPLYSMVKRKMNISKKEVDKKNKSIEKVFPDDKIDRQDGIKIVGKDWWVQIRSSNTEPIARLMAEAADSTKATQLIGSIQSVFRKK